MGKDGGFMTAKAISKRIKAKGLGRLRWYCQMCEKQCRDENGFKCHTQSAGHQRQLALFAESPSEFISKFSITFQREFLSILCQRYGTGMVNANSVYQEYIKDKDHTHMNATKWTTLTEFVRDMGKEGLCKVQDRDDGFWISFVDREVAEKDRLARERDLHLLEEEYRTEKTLQQQIRAAKALDVMDDDGGNNDVVGEERPETLYMRISNRHHARAANASFDGNALLSVFNPAKTQTSNTSQGATGHERTRSRWDIAPSLSVCESVDRELPSRASDVNGTPEAKDQVDILRSKEQDGPWIAKNIIVKVTNKEVGNGAFFGKKGKVINVIDEYGARVSLLNSNIVLELDQDDLETVIPKAGGLVLVLSGERRGEKATIKSINVDAFNVTVTLTKTGEELQAIEYEMVSRLSS